MNKTIIAIYGVSGAGKSDTIKRVSQTILASFPNVQAIPPVDNYEYDILLIIQIGNIKIGIESQGDPGSRLVNEKNSLEGLAKQNCDIIICATRTRGDTVNKIDEIALKYDYYTLWISSFWSPKLNHQVLNQMAAENVITIIKSLVIGQL